MKKNVNLNIAKKEQNDEFYTLYEDIENELQHYKQYFYNKIVYCNCDVPDKSQFVQYFINNFQNLGLQKLIATSHNKNGVYFEYNGVSSQKNNLIGNGDFRSEECLDILQNCDIVVTNPPFSLFREFIKCMTQYNKHFIVLGNSNAVTYKEIFPLIKSNQLWLGATLFTGKMPYFKVPDDYEITNDRIIINDKGERLKQVNSIAWFTNLVHDKYHKPLTLTQKYNPDIYPQYDNYNAIEVSKTKDIPMDYDGVMGVPITSLNKLDPNQFEIIGITDSFDKNDDIESIRTHDKMRDRCYVNGKRLYARILIKRKNKSEQINDIEKK